MQHLQPNTTLQGGKYKIKCLAATLLGKSPTVNPLPIV